MVDADTGNKSKVRPEVAAELAGEKEEKDNKNHFSKEKKLLFKIHEVKSELPIYNFQSITNNCQEFCRFFTFFVILSGAKDLANKVSVKYIRPSIASDATSA